MMLPSPVDATTEISLKDQVLAILSLASRRGRTRIPILEFFSGFAGLADKFPDMVPDLVFNKTAYSAYSKRLDGAIQGLVGFSVDLPNPKLQCLEVTPEAADRHLAWLDEKYGHAYIRSLEPLVEALIQGLSD